MTGLLLRAVGLATIYLLVLSSLDPGDLLVAGLLGLAIASTVRSRSHRPGTAPSARAIRAFGRMVVETARGMIIGSWRVVRFCLGAEYAPGFVEIPREGRSRRSVALWGVLTAETPDEVPVDVDETRDVLIVHTIDASDPDAVRARHHSAHERTIRHVVS